MIGLLAGLATTSCGVSAATPNGNYAYAPAAYNTGDRQLLLFPPVGAQEVRVPLPAALGGYRLTPDGASIYSTLFRLELRSMKTEDVPGFSRFRAFASMAVSDGQQNIIVAGKQWDGERLVCGVFLLSLRDGGVNRVVADGDCDDAMTRTDISLSPDGNYAVAIHGHSLELIELGHGGIRKLGDGYQKVAWSPDGKWIAAAKQSLLRAGMVLFDGRSFAERKTLASSMVLRVLWSPDGRFLLGRKSTAGCGPDEFTYESFEVETGRASLVESSRCKVDWRDNDVGWVERTIGQPPH